jgi:hypothetical protein
VLKLAVILTSCTLAHQHLYVWVKCKRCTGLVGDLCEFCMSEELWNFVLVV